MYELNEQTVDLLDRVRGKLETDLEEMYSISTAAGSSAAPGIHKAMSNPTDVADAFDMYLDTILERLVNETDMSEDEAVAHILNMADQCAREGDLSEWPGDGGSDDEVSIWLGKAKTMGFQHKVMRMAYGG
jgi:hypothetical protein